MYERQVAFQFDVVFKAITKYYCSLKIKTKQNKNGAGTSTLSNVEADNQLEKSPGGHEVFEP